MAIYLFTCRFLVKEHQTPIDNNSGKGVPHIFMSSRIISWFLVSFSWHGGELRHLMSLILLCVGPCFLQHCTAADFLVLKNHQHNLENWVQVMLTVKWHVVILLPIFCSHANKLMVQLLLISKRDLKNVSTNSSQANKKCIIIPYLKQIWNDL